MILCFDTETTGKYDRNASPGAKHQPRIVQIGAVMLTNELKPVLHLNAILQPVGFEIDNKSEAVAIHGITQEIAMECGVQPSDFWPLFSSACRRCETVMAYNCSFDLSMITVEVTHKALLPPWHNGFKRIDVMMLAKDIVKLPPNPGYSDWKYPKLSEAYEHLLKKPLKGAHGALWDCVATIAVYKEILKVKANGKPEQK